MRVQTLLATCFLLFILGLRSQTLAIKVDPVTDQFNEAIKESTKLFNNHEYRRALVSLRRADQLIPSPELHYNMAMCYEYLSESENQLIELNRYLETELSTAEDALKQKDVARAKVLLLATRQAKEEKPSLPIYKRWWLWTIAGTVAVAAVGIPLGVFAGQVAANTPSGSQAIQMPITLAAHPAVFSVPLMVFR